MFDVEVNKCAFVGVVFSNKIIYNVVENEGEFEYTGMSVIQFLKNDKNKFISLLMESQSYDSIKYLFDDKMVFGDGYDKSNSNYESFEDIYHLMKNSEIFEYFYIYDMSNDTLIVKIPESGIIGLDYKNSKDIRKFINSIKGE